MSSLLNPSSWRLTTVGDKKIKYKLLERSGSSSLEGNEAKEVYIIQASDLGAFITESFGGDQITQFGIPVRIVRRMPTGQGVTAQFITRTVEWEALSGGGLSGGTPTDPFGADPDAPSGTYEQFLKVTISYSTQGLGPGEDEPDPNTATSFVEVSADAAGDFLHTDAPKAKWQGEAGGIKEQNREATIPATILVPETQWNATWRFPISRKFMCDELVPKMRAAMGKLNSSPMDVFCDAPIETILFVGWRWRESFTLVTAEDGSHREEISVSLSMMFLEKNFQDKAITGTHAVTIASITLTPGTGLGGTPKIWEIDFNEDLPAGINPGEYFTDAAGNRFEITGVNDATGTILVQDTFGIDKEPTATGTNEILLQVTEEVNITHNHFWRPDKGAWQILLIDGTDRVFGTSDLNKLILPPVA